MAPAMKRFRKKGERGMFSLLFEVLFTGDPPQTEIGEVNTINSFAAPRNAQGVSVNTTTPPVPRVNSINSWAEVRNAQGLPVNSNQATSG